MLKQTHFCAFQIIKASTNLRDIHRPWAGKEKLCRIQEILFHKLETG